MVGITCFEDENAFLGSECFYHQPISSLELRDLHPLNLEPNLISPREHCEVNCLQLRHFSPRTPENPTSNKLEGI